MRSRNKPCPMATHEYNSDIDMLFSPGLDWHVDIWLPLDAQITEIHLRVYSFVFPDNIYAITWGYIKPNGSRLQIPIDAAKIGTSTPDEMVRLAFDITYDSNATSKKR
jgi:hypothetical protein